jgi:hypothetical protein
MISSDWFEPHKFSDFKVLASNSELSNYEKIGFPNSYRENFEKDIFKDLEMKLTNLSKKNLKIMDVGPGVSDLPRLLIEHSIVSNSQIFLIDSVEMLNQLPNHSNITKIFGSFPAVLEENTNFLKKLDVILMYSVIQYIAFEESLFKAFDLALELLAPKGQLLIGDIPNLSMRNRFFSSESGIEFHKKFMNTNQPPLVKQFEYPQNSFDDSMIFALLQRARNRGFHSYVLPQQENLPLANRREDILIVNP